MRFANLDQWLAWQETLHPREIELGLDRVGQVLGRMACEPGYRIVSVTGTNGKGSLVAMLEAVFRAAGYRVGTFLSPHLVRYNERIRLNGREASDEAICGAFERVDAARSGISLTYFEFATLAAVDLFDRAGADVALMEVGMGGRLDAVNVLDADCAVVTTVDLDHAAWLGNDRDSIAREKAGIFRRDRPAVYADFDPPPALLDSAAAIGADLRRLGEEFDYTVGDGRWRWQGGGKVLEHLPLRDGTASWWLKCAAGALAALDTVEPILPVSRAAVEEGLTAYGLPGRFQVVPGPVTEIFDVAHNPQAARELAAGLSRAACPGRTHAVFAILADKDIEGVATALAGCVERWHVAGLRVPRGASADLAAQGLPEGAAIERHGSVAEALAAARYHARAGDRIVVFGSFHTVAAAFSEPYNRPSEDAAINEVAS